MFAWVCQFWSASESLPRFSGGRKSCLKAEEREAWAVSGPRTKRARPSQRLVLTVDSRVFWHHCGLLASVGPCLWASSAQRLQQLWFVCHFFSRLWQDQCVFSLFEFCISQQFSSSLPQLHKNSLYNNFSFTKFSTSLPSVNIFNFVFFWVLETTLVTSACGSASAGPGPG